MSTNNLVLPLSEKEILETIERILVKISGAYTTKHNAWRFFLDKKAFIDAYNNFCYGYFPGLFKKLC